MHSAHRERRFIRACADALFTQRLFDGRYLRAKRRHDTDNLMKRFAVMRFNILLVICQPGSYRFSLKLNYIDFRYLPALLYHQYGDNPLRALNCSLHTLF
jgi:hypothetical protein